MSRPRLFYVLDTLEENEVGEQVATLLERLSRARFEPRVVGLGGKGALGARVRQMSVTVHQLDIQGPLGALRAVPRLRQILRNLRAELVHTFQPWSGAVAQLAAPRGARVFRSVRGFAPGPRTLEQRVQAWVERRAGHVRERHFTVADALAVDAVRRRFGANGIEVVPECLDLGSVRERTEALGAREARLRMGMAEGQRGVAVVSDFRERAVPIQILEGFATARVESPDLRLFLVGEGAEEGAVRWRAEELRLEDSVVFLGRTAADPTALLRTSEALVDAGSWPGWSRLALEAMALRLPVLRWVEDDDETGQARYPACTAGPPDRFARDLLDVLEGGRERKRVSTLGAAESQHYDVATVADLWAEIYSR